MEILVIRILEEAGATEYLPQFARHRITIETLLQMDDNDLKRVGIHEESLRKAVLREVDKFRQEEERRAEEKKECVAMPLLKGSFSRQRIPSAPPFTDHDSLEIEEIKARGINSQCTVCMDAQSEILFLNCGHVCTCAKCAEPLKVCPLDRAEIVQKIHLLPSPDTLTTTDDAF